MTPLSSKCRSMLFAPGGRPDVLRKLPRSAPDFAVLDLEDAVAPSGKEAARKVVIDVLSEVVAGMSGGVLVRINGTDTEWWREDLAVCTNELAGVVLPKAESVSQIDEVASALDDIGLSELGILAGIETGWGVERATELCTHPRVVATYFGAEDYCADIGGRRQSDNAEVLWARSRVALSASLGRIPAFDQVVVDFRDDTRLRRECHEAASLGYAGKLCIHPAQVEATHEELTPTAEEMERADRIVTAHAEAAAEGSGVVVVDGAMIDEPLVRQARQILAAYGEGDGKDDSEIEIK